MQTLCNFLSLAQFQAQLVKHCGERRKWGVGGCSRQHLPFFTHMLSAGRRSDENILTWPGFSAWLSPGSTCIFKGLLPRPQGDRWPLPGKEEVGDWAQLGIGCLPRLHNHHKGLPGGAVEPRAGLHLQDPRAPFDPWTSRGGPGIHNNGLLLPST